MADQALPLSLTPSGSICPSGSDSPATLPSGSLQTRFLGFMACGPGETSFLPDSSVGFETSAVPHPGTGPQAEAQLVWPGPGTGVCM